MYLSYPFGLPSLTVWLQMWGSCLEGSIIPSSVCATNPSRNQQDSRLRAGAIVRNRDLAHRVHRHQRTKFKSTVVGCGEKERTARHRMCDLQHSRAGGGTMKRQAFSLVSLLSLLLVAGSAIGQTVHVRANIPFNFAVGSKTLPAGTYDVGSIDHVNTKILRIQARDGNASMIVGSNAAQNLKPADKTKLVFNRYGNHYFLSAIWVSGTRLGHQLPKTSREKELAKDFAQDLTQRRVEIMASLQ
jgi:hypothetical protein